MIPPITASPGGSKATPLSLNIAALRPVALPPSSSLPTQQWDPDALRILGREPIIRRNCRKDQSPENVPSFLRSSFMSSDLIHSPPKCLVPERTFLPKSAPLLVPGRCPLPQGLRSPGLSGSSSCSCPRHGAWRPAQPSSLLCWDPDQF